MNTIEVGSRDEYSSHAEELVHIYDKEFVPAHAPTWPEPRGGSDSEPMVAKLDGVVTGRAFMETELYPLAELQNLYVSPSARGKGLGDSLVGAAVKRAADLGYLAVHLQTDLDNTVAQRLYASHGFLPAQQGERLRMIRFINLPLLSSFLATHPLTAFDSRPESAESRLWVMEWRDLVTADFVRLHLSGGSCQGDSDGFAPGVAGVEFSVGNTGCGASLSGPDQIRIDEEFGLELSLAGTGQAPVSGRVRLMLNPGFAPGADSGSTREFAIEPGAAESLTLSAVCTLAFDTDFWKRAAYPSVSVGVEVLLGSLSFWLVRQVKVA